jgi:hypothetical protein
MERGFLQHSTVPFAEQGRKPGVFVSIWSRKGRKVPIWFKLA